MSKGEIEKLVKPELLKPKVRFISCEMFGSNLIMKRELTLRGIQLVLLCVAINKKGGDCWK